ncbi:hypothetical protein [Demequina litorisediminis]|uniref:Uncharacterized protein n=1 Tax=Demequina litorisediminis TaxID=1849022 RepID=A0ABQ6IIX7_9MICO|nr:hypothetical protein [Demequina litorisediminis]GMA37810.1 hypothetical protein GCM10025876_40140 [Demequina litorisediminis]GMA37870.1 hypothetical protein GCM10025876_40740 [Demequina litorisediminis]GMA37925.1 hypothetical protein GCM10025876_41290 [Demequina litorisediminis]
MRILVAKWPTVTAQVNDNARAVVWTSTAAENLKAYNLERTRAGVLTRTVQVAIQLGRAVALNVTDPDGEWHLAVTPAGIVVEHTLGEPYVDVDDDLMPVKGPCRQCNTPCAITAASCSTCRVEAPTSAAEGLQLLNPSAWSHA